MTHKGKFRRSDLQQLLEEAQHVLAFSLPPVLWSYTPREFNRCADYLASVARDHVKEHFTQSSPEYFSLLPFFFPLSPSLQSQFCASSPLRIEASIPTLTLPELPSLPMKFSPLLFRLYRHTVILHLLPVIYVRFIRCVPPLSKVFRCITVLLPPTTEAAFIPHRWGRQSSLVFCCWCSWCW